MAAETTPNLRLLKAVVILLGIAILVVLVVIVVTVVRRAGDVVRPAAQEAVQEAAQEYTVLGSFDDRRIAIPAGAEVAGMTSAGGRLVLRLRLADGGTALLMLDPATGRRLGRVTLVPERP